MTTYDEGLKRLHTLAANATAGTTLIVAARLLCKHGYGDASAKLLEISQEVLAAVEVENEMWLEAK